MKTAEAEGPALDWLVAKCEEIKTDEGNYYSSVAWKDGDWFHPSTDWSQGGPIIEREGIMVYQTEPNCWWANSSKRAFERIEIAGWGVASIFSPAQSYNGPTPLIAAMRCYVASKLGDEVDVPEELA